MTSQMTPRNFLVRGLLVGLLAGLCAFAVAYVAGEPHVETAIQLEESAAPAAEESESHDHADEGHSHGEGAAGTEVSRDNQRTWGLLTGTLAVGTALGGLVALVSAAAAGRLGRMSVAQSTAVVAAVGFVAVALVPFLKYPPNPPAVGSGETIGSRTAVYFVLLLVSVVAAVVAVVLAARLARSAGAMPAVVGAGAAYVVLMVAVTTVMPTVNEVGDFPADILWYFRLSSLFTLATMWAVIGVGLAWTTGTLQQRAEADHARREMAASL